MREHISNVLLEITVFDNLRYDTLHPLAGFIVASFVTGAPMSDQELEIVKSGPSHENPEWHAPVMTSYDMADTEQGGATTSDSVVSS